MGFAELLLIAVLGLIVIGPKRLPETVRSVALVIGRLKRMMASARTEMEKEFGVDDIRRQLHNEQVLSSLDQNESPEKSVIPETDPGDKKDN